jgi:hypothetical protein
VCLRGAAAGWLPMQRRRSRELGGGVLARVEVLEAPVPAHAAAAPEPRGLGELRHVHVLHRGLPHADRPRRRDHLLGTSAAAGVLGGLRLAVVVLAHLRQRRRGGRPHGRVPRLHAAVGREAPLQRRAAGGRLRLGRAVDGEGHAARAPHVARQARRGAARPATARLPSFLEIHRRSAA